MEALVRLMSKKIKGERGYINYIKKYYIVTASLLLVLLLLLVFLGRIFPSFFFLSKLFTGFIILFVALAIARYFSYSKFTSIKEEELYLFDSYKDTAIFELLFVDGKETYYIKALLITTSFIYVLSDSSNFDTSSFEKILVKKGINKKVILVKEKLENGLPLEKDVKPYQKILENCI